MPETEVLWCVQRKVVGSACTTLHPNKLYDFTESSSLSLSRSQKIRPDDMDALHHTFSNWYDHISDNFQIVDLAHRTQERVLSNGATSITH